LILCNLLLHVYALFLQLHIRLLCAIKFYLLTYLSGQRSSAFSGVTLWNGFPSAGYHQTVQHFILIHLFLSTL